MRFQRFGSVWIFGSNVVILAMALCATCGNPCAAQSIAFAPQVGQKYDYGIELRIQESDPKNSGDPITVRQRCRLRYEITSATSDGWSASFKTIPFLGSKLAKDNDEIIASFESEKRNAKSMAEIAKRSSEFRRRNNHPSPFSGTSLDFGSRMDGLQARAVSNRYELVRRRAVQIERYPGIFMCCEGAIRSDARGNVTIESGFGGLPLALGHVAKMIFVGLPENGAVESGFSSKRLNNIFLSSVADVGEDGKEPEVRKTEMSVLSLFSPTQGASDQVMAFDREIESSGGATAGAKIVVSGRGTWEYGPAIKMPFAGSVDYEIEGLTYFGVSDEFKARAGFHYLDQMGAYLFDKDLLPKPTALERENMPRLTERQIREIAKQLGNSKANRSLILSNLMDYAPPPRDSRLYKEVKKLSILGKMPENAGSMSASIFGFKSMGESAMTLVEHWDLTREVATRLPRTWSDPAGDFSVTAKIVGVADERVYLRRTDNGKTINVPLDRLSEKDQEFAKIFGKTPKSE